MRQQLNNETRYTKLWFVLYFSLEFDYYLQCDQDFYGNCDKYCHPDPDKYSCDSSGSRVCKPLSGKSISNNTVKTALSGHSKELQDQLSLNAGQNYSILQYFPPSLSYHLSLRPLFYLFLSGRLRQVLLYMDQPLR